MKQQGFTLIEMIAVIGIIAMIAMVSIPMISNQIAEKRTEISDVTQQGIYNAAELYFSDHQTEYPKTVGESYCVSLDKLVSSGMLQSPITDYKTGDTISLTTNVKTTVNSYSEYSQFELAESC